MTSKMPITVKELKKMLESCDDEARITARIVNWSGEETTGWVAARHEKTIFKEKGLQIMVDNRSLD